MKTMETASTPEELNRCVEDFAEKLTQFKEKSTGNQFEYFKATPAFERLSQAFQTLVQKKLESMS
jgi:hypothetical protein